MVVKTCSMVQGKSTRQNAGAWTARDSAGKIFFVSQTSRLLRWRPCTFYRRKLSWRCLLSKGGNSEGHKVLSIEGNRRWGCLQANCLPADK